MLVALGPATAQQEAARFETVARSCESADMLAGFFSRPSDDFVKDSYVFDIATVVNLLAPISVYQQVKAQPFQL